PISGARKLSEGTEAAGVNSSTASSAFMKRLTPRQGMRWKTGHINPKKPSAESRYKPQAISYLYSINMFNLCVEQCAASFGAPTGPGLLGEKPHFLHIIFSGRRHLQIEAFLINTGENIRGRDPGELPVRQQWHVHHVYGDAN